MKNKPFIEDSPEVFLDVYNKISPYLGKYAFRMSDTKGIPLEITLETFGKLSIKDLHDLALSEYVREKK